MVKHNLISLNKLIRDKKSTEITKKNGIYYILHITKNNVPVPLFFSKNVDEIADEIEIRGF